MTAAEHEPLSRRGRPPMEVVEFRPEREQYAFTFGGVAPVRKVTPGTVLRLWTEDAFCGTHPAHHGHAERGADHAVRQPADRPVLRGGRGARRHAGAAFRGPQPGPGLRRVLHDPALRRADEHRPHRDAAGPAARADLDLRGGPRRGGRSRSRPRPASCGWSCRWIPCSARSAWRRRPARCAPRWCRTRSAGTWTPRRCAPARPATWGSTSTARCSRWATGTTGRARARRAAPRWKARWTSRSSWT